MSGTKKVPIRKCMGCREMKPKKELIRLVRTPESKIEIDHTGKKNGRGAYLCKSGKCFDNAVKTKQLSRSLHAEIPGNMLMLIEKELMQNEE